MVLIVLWWPVGVLIHEAGHALVAWVLGFRVIEVQVGDGPSLVTFRWKGVPWRFGRQPWSGWIRVAHADPWKARYRYLAVLVAGAASNLLAAGLPLCALLSMPFTFRMLGNQDHVGTLIFNAFMYCQLGCAASSLFSRGVQINGQPALSDGEQLRFLRALVRCPYYEEWCRLASRPEIQPASGDSSWSFWNRFTTGTDAAQVDRLLKSLIQWPAHDDRGRLLWLDCYCTWALFLAKEPYLSESVEFSEQLFRNRKHNWSYLGTRGSLLIAVGRVEDGMACLEVLLAGKHSQTDRVIACSCLALGAHRLENVAARDRWWQESLAYHDGKPVIPWIARELGQPVPEDC